MAPSEKPDKKPRREPDRDSSQTQGSDEIQNSPHQQRIKWNPLKDDWGCQKNERSRLEDSTCLGNQGKHSAHAVTENGRRLSSRGTGFRPNNGEVFVEVGIEIPASWPPEAKPAEKNTKA